MPEAYNRVRINGIIPGGERWSINVNYLAPFGFLVTSFADLNLWATTIGGLNTGLIFPPTWRSLISAVVSISSIRCEYYDTSGSLSQAGEFVLPAPVAGTGGAIHPPQTALAVSILTGRPGRSYRGRFYLPALAAQVSGVTLRIVTPTLSTFISEGRVFLIAMGTSAPTPASIAVAVTSGTLGVNTRASAINVGDILDVQTRRRDRLVEQRTTSAPM